MAGGVEEIMEWEGVLRETCYVIRERMPDGFPAHVSRSHAARSLRQERRVHHIGVRNVAADKALCLQPGGDILDLGLTGDAAAGEGRHRVSVLDGLRHAPCSIKTP